MVKNAKLTWSKINDRTIASASVCGRAGTFQFREPVEKYGTRFQKRCE